MIVDAAEKTHGRKMFLFPPFAYKVLSHDIPKGIMKERCTGISCIEERVLWLSPPKYLLLCSLYYSSFNPSIHTVLCMKTPLITGWLDISELSHLFLTLLQYDCKIGICHVMSAFFCWSAIILVPCVLLTQI